MSSKHFYKTQKTIFLILTSILFFSCSVQELSIGNPEGVDIDELSMKNVRLKIFVPIENPNNFSFKVKSVNLDLIVNGKNVGKVKKLEKIRIPANSKQTYNVSFEVSTTEALSTVLFLVNELQRRSPKLEVSGTITVSKLGIPKRIKVNHSQNFDKY